MPHRPAMSGSTDGSRSCRNHRKNMSFTSSSHPARPARLAGDFQPRAPRALLARVISGLVFGGAAILASATSWTTLTIDTIPVMGGGFRTTTLAHLPDGRFVFGNQGQLFVQNSFGLAGKTAVPVGALELDPSFIAVRDAGNAIVGRGGFAATSELHVFNPSSPGTGVTPASLASLLNYSGAYWKSPTSALEGWLVCGANGAAGASNVMFVSLDGTKVGPVTGTISTFSGGIATDAAGNLFAATYELDFQTFLPTADADKVFKFPAALMESAVQAVMAGAPAPVPISSAQFIYKFDGTSNIAVDSLGRVWAAGFSASHIQVFDPALQATSRLRPADSGFAPGTPVLYTVRTFTLGVAGQTAFLAQDLNGGELTNIYTGHAADSAIEIPRFDSWRAQHFGVQNLTLGSEAALWGAAADPDFDGASNAMEYALGTQPGAADAALMAGGVSGGALTFTFHRDPLNTDLTYIVEICGTLAANDWQEIARSTAGAPTTSSGIGAGSVSEVAEGARFRVTVTDAATAQPRRFARLRLILQPP